MSEIIVTNLTLTDSCLFPGNRFGLPYTSRLSQNILTQVLDGMDVVHPDDDNVSEYESDSGSLIVNNLCDGFSFLSKTRNNYTSNASPEKINTNETKTSRGSTIVSTFGGAASDVNTIPVNRGAIVIGKLC